MPSVGLVTERRPGKRDYGSVYRTSFIQWAFNANILDVPFDNDCICVCVFCWHSFKFIAAIKIIKKTIKKKNKNVKRPHDGPVFDECNNQFRRFLKYACTTQNKNYIRSADMMHAFTCRKPRTLAKHTRHTFIKSALIRIDAAAVAAGCAHILISVQQF